MTRKINVAFIGLGKMGSGVAHNIHKAGFLSNVYNRTPKKTEPFADLGVAVAASPAEAAGGVDVVVSSLMGDESVLESTAGENGILATLKKGGIHIGISTVSPSCADRLADLHKNHGSAYVAAPVVGRPDAAKAGQLVSFVAGEAEVIDRCHQVIDSYSAMVNVVGERQGMANTVKLGINYIVVSSIELMSQVYAFAEKSGVDVNIFHGLFQMIYAHPVLQMYATKIKDRDFDDAGFSLDGGLKDVLLMLEASNRVYAPLNFGNIIKDKFLFAMSNGLADKDWSAIYEVSRKSAGL